MSPVAVGETGVPRALPQESVYRQLRATPRIFVFMGFLLGAAVSLGAKEVARWQYIDQSYESEWSLGASAAVSATMLAISGVVLGRVIDRRDPRPYVMVAFGLAAVGNIALGLALLRGPLPVWLILVGACIDGTVLGIGGIAVLKTQAAFVRPGANGAAEILNILRLGIGGVMGAVLAGLIPNPGATLIGSAVLLVLCLFGAWASMRLVPPRLAGARDAKARAPLVSYLRSASSLRKTIAIDLVLSLVVPTQLVNLVLLDMDVPDLASRSIAAGMVGVLVGRLALTLVGFRGDVRIILLMTVGGLSVVQYLGAVSLTGGWLFDQALALPLIIIIGSACGTYAQGLLAAIIQQQVAEDHRGGVASVLVVGRNVLISIGALGGVLVATTAGSQVLIALQASGLMAVIIINRGFGAFAQGSSKRT